MKTFCKSVKSIFISVFVVFFCVSIFSCASTKIYEVPELTKYDDMMFWKIEGSDSNGKPACIYVLGTIHIGDDRLYPIPKEILNAYGKADKVYGEISTNGWNELTAATVSRVLQAQIQAAEWEAENGISWYDTLTEEQQQFLVEKFGEAVVNANKDFMPWVLSSAMSELSFVGTGLTANYSYDIHFISVSNELGIEMLGLDDLDVQLDIMAYGDMEFQLNMLQASIDEYLKDEDISKNETLDIYKAYLTGEEEQLEKILFSEMDKEIAEDPEMQGYYNALFVDRNNNWAELFSQLILEGGNTFVFAGAGHFVGEESVFQIMKNNGNLIF